MQGPGKTGANDERGAAAVEFALVFPLLMLLIGGVIDFGFAFNAQISLTHAAREGVRVEAIGSGDPETTALAAFNAPAVTGATMDLAASRTCPDDDGARVVLEANYEFFLLTIIPGFPDDINLQGQAVMRCGG